MAIDDVPAEHRIYLWTCFAAVLFGYLVNFWTWTVAGRRKLATVPGPVIWRVQYALLNNNLWQSTLTIWFLHTAAIAGSYWFSPPAKTLGRVEFFSALCVGWAASKIVWGLWNLSAVGVDLTASASESLTTLRPVSKARLMILCALMTGYAYLGGIYTHESYFTAWVSFSTVLSIVITAGAYQIKKHWWGALTNGWRGWTFKAFYPYVMIAGFDLYMRFYKGISPSYTSFFTALLSNPVLGDDVGILQANYGLRIFKNGILSGYAVIFCALIMMRCLRFDQHKSHFTRIDDVVEEMATLPLATPPPVAAEDKAMIDTALKSSDEKDEKSLLSSNDHDIESKPAPPKTKTKTIQRTLAPVRFKRPYFRLASAIYVLIHLAVLFSLYSVGKSFSTVGAYALWSHQAVETVMVPCVLGMAWLRGDLRALWNFD